MMRDDFYILDLNVYACYIQWSEQECLLSQSLKALIGFRKRKKFGHPCYTVYLSKNPVIHQIPSV